MIQGAGRNPAPAVAPREQHRLRRNDMISRSLLFVCAPGGVKIPQYRDFPAVSRSKFLMHHIETFYGSEIPSLQPLAGSQRGHSGASGAGCDILIQESLRAPAMPADAERASNWRNEYVRSVP
jgi:hypothetical protein